MTIPVSFEIAGGKKISVQMLDIIKDSSNSYIYGDFCDVNNNIRLARKIDTTEYGMIELTEEDIARTFLHELYHAFQFYSGKEYDEQEAQIFSNFMYEYTKTAK